jgi:hypothetical protein
MEATVSILDERELTDAERAAIADEPRPGVWIQDADPLRGRHFVGDGRLFSQDNTDCLIARELEWSHRVDHALLTPWRRTVQVEWDAHLKKPRSAPAEQQRGGIHSDPLVRLLAFRAWGDRDRAFLDDTGVLAGEPVTRLNNTIVKAWPSEAPYWVASRNAMPGEQISIRQPRTNGTDHGIVGTRKRTPAAR